MEQSEAAGPLQALGAVLDRRLRERLSTNLQPK
jgi:hypothetical protein